MDYYFAFQLFYHKIRFLYAPEEENVNYLMSSHYNEDTTWPKFVPNSLREAEPAARLWYIGDKEEETEEETEDE